ncbi:MAG: ATP-binding protein, partial [Bryobacteraceae bacterium]
PFRVATKELSDSLRKLARPEPDWPRQAQTVERLKTLSEALATELAEKTKFLNDPTKSAEAVDEGRRSMIEIKAAAAEMRREKRELLVERLAHVAQLQKRAVVIMVVAIVLGLGGGLLGILLLTAGVTRRVERLQRNAARLESEEQELDLPAGDDEIGRLGRALGGAHELLRSRQGQLRQANAFLEHLIRSSPVVIFHQDLTQARFSYVSPNVERLFGYTPEQIARDGFFIERVHPDDVSKLASFTEGTRDHTIRFRAGEGEYRTIRAVVAVEKDAEERPASLLGFLIDVTEAVKLTEALAASNAELESFSYSVSHDLRAPLRGINGFCQALLEDCEPLLDERGRAYLNRVRAATDRMALLIDGMLTLSRVTRSELHATPVDLSALAGRIASDLRRAEPERQVEWVVEPGIVVEGDPLLLELMLENLLRNAFKFTSRKETARIEFGGSPGVDGRQRCFVRDDGAGFDMAYADKLFGAFQRLHGAGEFPGTGIGLATAQRIVRRHGGKIWAEGAVNQGAAFYFELK